jgi:hypothetical protein
MDEIARAIEAGAKLKSLSISGAEFGEFTCSDEEPKSVTFTDDELGLLLVDDVEDGIVRVNDVKPGTKAHAQLHPPLVLTAVCGKSVHTVAEVEGHEAVSRRPLSMTFYRPPCRFERFWKAVCESQITEVDVSSCGLNPAAMEILIACVQTRRSAIVHLALGSNPIGDEAITQILDAVSSFFPLKFLDISHTGCGDRTATKLAAFPGVHMETSAEEAERELPKVVPRSMWKTGPRCMACSVTFFKPWLRRHHCRVCGFQFCDTCSSGRVMLSDYANPERVCDCCGRGRVVVRAEFSRPGPVGLDFKGKSIEYLHEEHMLRHELQGELQVGMTLVEVQGINVENHGIDDAQALFQKYREAQTPVCLAFIKSRTQRVSITIKCAGNAFGDDHLEALRKTMESDTAEGYTLRW